MVSIGTTRLHLKNLHLPTRTCLLLFLQRRAVGLRNGNAVCLLWGRNSWSSCHKGIAPAAITMFTENKHLLCSAPAICCLCADRAKARGHCAVNPLRTNITARCSSRSSIDFISRLQTPRSDLIPQHHSTGPTGVPTYRWKLQRYGRSTSITYTDTKSIRIFFSWHRLSNNSLMRIQFENTIMSNALTSVTGRSVMVLCIGVT